MSDEILHDRRPRASRWRGLIWGAAAALLLLPAVAMRFTDEVRWDETDFLVMGALLFGTCGLYELGTRLSRSPAYHAAMGLGALAAFLQTWIDLAVGIYGADDDANFATLGVLAVAAVGALTARFRAAGMARAMVATAVAQLAAGGFGLYVGVVHALVLGVALAVVWLAAAWLFGRAAHATPAVRAR